eukprot:6240130-Prymnesium_polylepis.2
MSVGGACDLRKHVSGELLELFRASEHSREHDYMPFYTRQLDLLQKAVGTEGIPVRGRRRARRGRRRAAA